MPTPQASKARKPARRSENEESRSSLPPRPGGGPSWLTLLLVGVVIVLAGDRVRLYYVKAAGESGDAQPPPLPLQQTTEPAVKLAAATATAVTTGEVEVRSLPRRRGDDAAIKASTEFKQDVQRQPAIPASASLLLPAKSGLARPQVTPPSPRPTGPPKSASATPATHKGGRRSFADLVEEFVGAVSRPVAAASSQPPPPPPPPPPPLALAPAVKRGQSTLSRAECSAKYGSLRFFSEKERRPPPMLYTFPGSGNTWGRLLIEYATGIYSGSVYNDKSLLEVLPGEFTCNFQVSVIKVHPHTHPGIELVDGTFNSDDHKCMRSNLRKFERALLLVRDPFDSIWSEYQRRFTQNHVLGIKNSTFDWYRWTANAANLATGYFEMWAYHYAAIERRLRQSDILFLRYEDLKSRDKRVDALRKITDFLHVKASDERLECAFIQAENPQAHRRIDVSAMTKDVAYTRPITCRMWALFGRFALRVGYPLSGARAAYNCTGFKPIQKINVGGSGEYNPLWVRPNAKPVDFGEHPPSDFVWGTVQRPRGLEDMWVVGGDKILMRNKPRPRGVKPRPELPGPGAGTGAGPGGPGAGAVAGGDMSLSQRSARWRQRREGQQAKRISKRGIGATEADLPDAVKPAPLATAEGGGARERKPPVGMSLDQALKVEGVGGVGDKKPAWQ